jgi:hypothetical protein
MVVNSSQKSGAIKRLHKVVIRASSQTTNNVPTLRARGNEKHRNRISRVPLSDLPKEVETIYVGHRDIEKNECWNFMI